MEVERIRARRVVNDALDKAESIVREAELFRGRIEEEFNEVLKSKIKEISQNSDKFLDLANKYYAELVKKSSERIEEAVAKKIEEISSTFDKRISEIKDEVLKEQMEAKRDTKERIKQLEETYLDDLRKKVGSRLPDIVAKVAGRSIGLKDHEDLLMNALSEAKNDGAWNE